MKNIIITRPQLGAYVRKLLVESANPWQWSGNVGSLKNHQATKNFIVNVVASLDGSGTDFGNQLEGFFIEAINASGAPKVSPAGGPAGELNVTDFPNTPFADVWLDDNPFPPIPNANTKGYHTFETISLSAKGTAIMGKDPLNGNEVKVGKLSIGAPGTGLGLLVSDVYKMLDFTSSTATKGILFKAGLVAYTPKIVAAEDIESSLKTSSGDPVFSDVLPTALSRNRPGTLTANIPFNTYSFVPKKYNFGIVSKAAYSRAVAKGPSVTAFANPRQTSAAFVDNMTNILLSQKMTRAVNPNNISALSEFLSDNKSGNSLLQLLEMVIGTKCYLLSFKDTLTKTQFSAKLLKRGVNRFTGSFLDQLFNPGGTTSTTIATAASGLDESEKEDMVREFGTILQTLIQVAKDPAKNSKNDYTTPIADFVDRMLDQADAGFKALKTKHSLGSNYAPVILAIITAINGLSTAAKRRRVAGRYLPSRSTGGVSPADQIKNLTADIIVRLDSKILTKADIGSAALGRDIETVGQALDPTARPNAVEPAVQLAADAVNRDVIFDRFSPGVSINDLKKGVITDPVFVKTDGEFIVGEATDYSCSTVPQFISSFLSHTDYMTKNLVLEFYFDPSDPESKGLDALEKMYQRAFKSSQTYGTTKPEVGATRLGNRGQARKKRIEDAYNFILNIKGKIDAELQQIESLLTTFVQAASSDPSFKPGVGGAIQPQTIMTAIQSIRQIDYDSFREKLMIINQNISVNYPPPGPTPTDVFNEFNTPVPPSTTSIAADIKAVVMSTKRFLDIPTGSSITLENLIKEASEMLDKEILESDLALGETADKTFDNILKLVKNTFSRLLSTVKIKSRELEAAISKPTRLVTAKPVEKTLVTVEESNLYESILIDLMKASQKKEKFISEKIVISRRQLRKLLKQLK